MRYDDQYAKHSIFHTESPNLQSLINIINTRYRGYDQKGY